MADPFRFHPRADRRIALMLALCSFLVYLPFTSGHFDGTDEITIYGMVESIWERGELALSHGGPHAMRGADGRSYGHFAVGQAILKLPFYGMGKLASQLLDQTWASAIAGPLRVTETGAVGSGTLEVFSVKIYGPAISAILVALFFLVERRLGVSPRNALLASILLGLTTYVATMSGTILRHSTETAMMLGVLCCTDAYRRSGRLLPLSAASALTSMLLIVSLPAAIAGPPLGAYLLWTVRTRILANGKPVQIWGLLAVIALPVLTAIGIHIAVNYAIWGSWLDNPMLGQRAHFTTPFYVGAFGLLFSPGGSIFAYAPLLILSPWTLSHLWRTHRPECLLILSIGGIFIAVHSTFWSWTGLWSAPGPRYMFAAMTLGMLALGPWLDATTSTRSRFFVAGFAGVGALVQASLLTASWTYVMHVMNYRKWAPKMEFMFIPDQSPILASARTLMEGVCDPWLCRLYEGWAGFDPRPLAVVVILMIWVLGFTAALWFLRRSYCAHPQTET